MFKRPTLAYMSYTISNGHSNIRGETLDLANQLMLKHPNLTVLVAITATSHTDKIQEYRSIASDITLIEKSDIFIMGKPLNYAESSGSVWEYFFARHLGKPCFTSDYLLGKSANPSTWRTQTREEKLKQLLSKN
jgi:hypothetical protein